MSGLYLPALGLEGFNWFDVLLVLIILWSALMGIRAGLARVVVGFIATVVGLFAGFWFYRMVAAQLSPWVPAATFANVLGFLIIFAGALILGSVVSSILGRVFKWFGLSWFDHFLGGVAGFLRGALVVAAVVDMTVAFSPSPAPEILEHSQVLPYASEVSTWLLNMAPRELRDAFTEQMDNLKQFWAKPPDNKSRAA
jgi:membrane protein required for colicin V production